MTALRSRPEFVVVGLDHTTAEVELRERFAFATEEIKAALRKVTDGAEPLLEQAAIVSTCNRVELYGVARSRPDRHRLGSLFASRHGLDYAAVASTLYVHRDEMVARHLAATAAGMNSMVLGEAQIQGQVRAALEHALEAGTAGAELRRLFESAIAAGRRVRGETAIGRGALSVPCAGVELAHGRLGTLSDCTVLIIGTGDAGQLAAKQLIRRQAKRILFLGRDPGRVRTLAQAYGGYAVAHGRLDAALAVADVVITATGASQPVIGRERLRRAVLHRPAGCAPLLVVDISAPRDVDPTASGLNGVEIHTLDDLRRAAESTLARRHAELPQAHALIAHETARFTDWVRRREALAAPGYSRRTRDHGSGAAEQVERPGASEPSPRIALSGPTLRDSRMSYAVSPMPS